MAATLTGVHGSIRWSYYHAARVEGYAITRTGKGPTAVWSVRATLIERDPFKLKQRPLTFVAPHAKGEWSWPLLDFTIDGTALTGRLGPVTEVFKKPPGESPLWSISSKPRSNDYH